MGNKEKSNNSFIKKFTAFIIWFFSTLFFLIIINENATNNTIEVLRDFSWKLIDFNATISVGLAALILTIFMQGKYPIKKRTALLRAVLDNFILFIVFNVLFLITTYMMCGIVCERTFYIFLTATIFLTVYILLDTRKIILTIFNIKKVTKKEFSKKMYEIEERTIQVSEEHATIIRNHELLTQPNMEQLKRKLQLKIEELRGIQTEINNVLSQSELESEEKELRESYAKYIQYIEGKSVEVNLNNINHDKLEIIQRLEVKEVKNILRLTQVLIDKYET